MVSSIPRLKKVFVLVVPSYAGTGRAYENPTAIVDHCLDHVLERRVQGIEPRLIGRALSHPVDARANQEHRYLHVAADRAVRNAPGHRRALVVESVRDHYHQFLFIGHRLCSFPFSISDRV
jgi:hypothetical protein